ncbi:hypothetical protein A4R26_32860 [Niastella populi]|uniref:Glycosyltransferase RgtA/B/C/D-like domain-containing protein n=2 Tax=Niastella populi TaxID=550983 RepID=A0A1V9GB36_9BACT|nr:hypothetical protein A4R26_32860 [Niastella populi]
MSFKAWLFKDDESRLLLKWSSVATIIAFTWLKILYPYPNFMPPDSYSYLDAAYNNEFINIWAIGYSKFLRLVSSFTDSHLALVIIQYLLVQISLLYLLLTIRYLFNPAKALFRVLFGLSVLNPLLPHIANFVSSDSLFTSLSLVWYTQLLWIIYKPTEKLLFRHSLILLLAFSTRHNALYYPLISIAVVILRSMPGRLKAYAIGSIAILLGSFILLTGSEYNKKTSSFQYSAFGGWQQAANALYGYAYDQLDEPVKLPPRFRKLHQLVNETVRIHQQQPFLRPDRNVGVFYLWDFQSPLRLYMDQVWKTDSTKEFFEKWASMAPLYGSYGTYLITRHPRSYILNYVWPNLQRYYAPPSQFMGWYNLGYKTVDSSAVKWFGWNNNTLPALGIKKIWVADIFTILTPIVNIIFIAGFLAFLTLGGNQNCSHHNKKLLGCTLTIWIANTLFSVLSAPIELRYQLFPLIISIIWSVIFVGYVVQVIRAKPETTEKQAEEAQKQLVFQPQQIIEKI